MPIQARPPHGREDDDGVRIVTLARGRRLFWLTALAVALPVVVTVIAVAVIRFAPADERGPAPAPPPAAADVPDAGAPGAAVVARPAPAASRAAERVTARRVERPLARDPGPAGLGASPVPEARQPTREIDAADAIVMLREEGVHDGIAAFGLPGSDPPKPGIIVPEGFPLPEGYVRHYQSTDDGEQLPAILMFHPDYEFFDPRGGAVPVPQDRVVPPELAPPGLDPANVLEVPARRGGEPLR